MKLANVALIVIASALVVAPASAQSALELEARQIDRMLMAPCCWAQTVAEHQSQAAVEVKQQVREWLAEGMTRRQVLDAFVARYGGRVLAEPPNSGFSRLLYVTPVVVFGASAFGLIVFVKKVTAARQLEASRDAPERGDGQYSERLDDELREMD